MSIKAWTGLLAALSVALLVSVFAGLAYIAEMHTHREVWADGHSGQSQALPIDKGVQLPYQRPAKVRYSGPVWKTITIGGKSIAQLKESLRAEDVAMDETAEDILGDESFRCFRQAQEVNLVKIGVGEMGFPRAKLISHREICLQAIKKFGLLMCPAEVGPQLRLQYSDQPEGERLTIGMAQPLLKSGAKPAFWIERDEFFEGRKIKGGKLMLKACTPGLSWSSPDRHHPDHVFVFMAPRPGNQHTSANFKSGIR